MEIQSQGHECKKRKVCFEDEESVLKGDTVPENDPMPYTCICFKDVFYTTDSEGYFVHNVKDVNNRVPLYRCEVTPQREVVFSFIHNISENELLHLENDVDINVIKNMGVNNKSLFY